MYTVTVESTFTASHQLTMADGGKEPLHGHDWVVRVAVSADELDETGLAVDFNDLKAMIADVTEPFTGARLKLDYAEVTEADGCWTKYCR